MRLAIIGCGLIGTKRALAARGHEIAVVCDVDAARAKHLAVTTGATPMTDWENAVAADVDAVIVATSHDQLAAITSAAIKCGHHVLVEKPAARNLAEARAIAKLAAREERVVKVGFNHRFHPGLQKARELVDAGVLGPLMFVRGRYGHGGRPGMENEWRCQREISGGGEAVDQGSHLIDLSRWFLGDLSLEYASLPTYYWDISVEDNCFVALRGRKNELAWLHASWTEWKNMFSFEIAGRDGKILVDGLGGSYGTERITWYRMLPEMGPPETTAWEYPFADRSWELEFSDFVAAIETGRRPCGDIADAVANFEILDQMYQRIRA